MNLSLETKNSPPPPPPSIKFKYNQVIILKIIKVSSFFHPLKLCDTLEIKGCYGNSLNNKYCQCMQNNSQRCEIKVRKFHLIIFCCFGVIEENSQEGEFPHPLPV